MTYFISGHRDLTEEEFEALYVPAIRGAISSDWDPKFVVGDYEGVDRMAQEYLKKVGLGDKVTVYHMFEKPRNCSDGLKTKGGFKSDEERDSAMTRDSDLDIAFVREGKRKSGTAQNIVRRHEFRGLRKNY